MAFYCEGSVDVVLDIPADGRYDVEVTAWAGQYGDEPARLDVSVGSDSERSRGARAIKAKLAKLHGKLLGADPDSTEVQAAYDLFVDVWSRRRGSDELDFRSTRCDFSHDAEYFDDVLDDIWVTNEHGDPDWDWDRVNSHLDSINWSDPHHVARTWAVVLAYLMTDPRYLHL